MNGIVKIGCESLACAVARYIGSASRYAFLDIALVAVLLMPCSRSAHAQGDITNVITDSVTRNVTDSIGRKIMAFVPGPEFRVGHVVVEPDYAGQRLDNFLIRLAKGVPKSHVYRIVRRQLAEDLGVEPGLELQSAQLRVLANRWIWASWAEMRGRNFSISPGNQRVLGSR
jgi:hypothetical protein